MRESWSIWRTNSIFWVESVAKHQIDKEKKVTLVGLLVGCFLISLDPNLVGIVTPELAEDLQATALYGWIAGSYLIALTVSVPVAGKAVEVFSVRKIYLTSIVVFLIGTALSALATHIHVFLAFRAVQGLGAGGIFATNFAVAAVLFPPRHQGVVLSYFNVASGLAMVAGAVVGGLLADYTTWRAAFWANFIPGIAMLALLAYKLPELKPEKPGRMDFGGAATLLMWCVPLMILCSLGNTASMKLSVGLLVVFAVGFGAFLWVESRHSEPLIDPRFMLKPTFRWGSLAAWTVGAVATSTMVYVPLFAVEAQNLSATSSSALLVTETVCAIGGSVLVGRLLLRTGSYKPLMLMSTLLSTGMLFWMGRHLTLSTPFWQLILLMIGIGLAFGVMMPLYPLAVQNSVQKEHVASASSSVQFSQMLGSSIGAAVTGLILSTSLNSSFPHVVSPEVRDHLMSGQSSGYTEKAKLEDQLKKNVANLREAMDEARAGNPHAETDIMNNPFVPQDLRDLVHDRTDESKEKIQEEFEELADRLGELIEKVIDGTVVLAVRKVYLSLAGLSFLTFLLSLLIPALPLREDPSEEDETRANEIVGE
jgi:EmrB/QacA subfamily drug resistance transporter